MEGIFLGKVDQTAFDPRCVSLSFGTKHLDQQVEVRKELDYDCDYVLVKANDVIVNNDELLKLRDEVKRLTDECNDWKVRYSTANNELFQKGLAYGTLERAYKNEKIAGELLLKDRDALKEKVEELIVELTEIKTARTLREAYVSGVEKGCESLREERDRWKIRCNSVMTDISNALSAHGIELTIKDVLGDVNWKLELDIPELNEAKKKVEDLETKLAASKSNETYWRDRKEEEEDYHHYWHYTFDRAVKQAAEKGVYIAIAGKDDDCNAGIVVVENKKTADLESQVVQMEDANQKLNQQVLQLEKDYQNLKEKLGAADNALEYWNNTYNDIVIAGKKVGVKINVKGKKPDINAGFVHVTNEKADELETRTYWRNTYYAAVEAAKNEGVTIVYQGMSPDHNAGIVKVMNHRTANLERRIKRLENDVVATKDRGDYWKRSYDDLAEYWDNTRKDLVARGKTVGVKIEFKYDASDGNVGYFDITNEKTIELMVKVSDTKHGYNKKWQAMLNALKDKGVEVIYMGEQDGKPCVDVKIPEIDILKKEYDDLNASYINCGSKIECLELDLKDEKDKVNKYEKLFKDACGMKDYWYGTYYEAVRQSWSQGVSIRIVEANLKDNIGTVQVNNERAEDLKKELENLKSKTVMDLSRAIDATSISCGTVPKCSSCAHYMHNPSRFAHDWCYRPVPKEGWAGYIRKLNKEEAEGPACSDFKAREE